MDVFGAKDCLLGPLAAVGLRRGESGADMGDVRVGGGETDGQAAPRLGALGRVPERQRELRRSVRRERVRGCEPARMYDAERLRLHAGAQPASRTEAGEASAGVGLVAKIEVQ